MSPEIKNYDEKMLKTIEVVKANFASVRAGRANAGVLDRITVEYYGTPTPLNQVAAVSSPRPPHPGHPALGRFSAEGHREGHPDL